MDKPSWWDTLSFFGKCASQTATDQLHRRRHVPIRSLESLSPPTTSTTANNWERFLPLTAKPTPNIMHFRSHRNRGSAVLLLRSQSSVFQAGLQCTCRIEISSRHFSRHHISVVMLNVVDAGAYPPICIPDLVLTAETYSTCMR